MNYADRIAREGFANRKMDVRAALRDRPCCGGQCVEDPVESVPWSRKFTVRCPRHAMAHIERVALRLARMQQRRVGVVQQAPCKGGACKRGSWPGYKHAWCWRHHPSRVGRIAVRLAAFKLRAATRLRSAV